MFSGTVPAKMREKMDLGPFAHLPLRSVSAGLLSPAFACSLWQYQSVSLSAEPSKGHTVLRTDLRNKNLSQHVTVGTSPDQSRDLGSLPGLRKQSPDRSHVRSHARSRVKSLVPLSVSGPLTSVRDGPKPGTSPLSIVNGIREAPLARPSRTVPTHRPIHSHDREKTSHG